MAILRAQVRFNRTTNIPEDIVVNTFHFTTVTAAPTAADFTYVISELQAFYEDVPTGAAGPVGALLSPVIPNSGHEIRIYNLSDSMPRPIRATGAIVLPTRSTSGLPSEVAMCLSWNAARTAGTPVGRTRGRIYLGPLVLGATQTTVIAGDIRPDTAAMTTLASAGLSLLTPGGVGDPVLVIYSRTDGQARPVVSCYVDNAFDTQRPRGADPTSRIVRP